MVGPRLYIGTKEEGYDFIKANEELWDSPVGMWD